MHQFGFIAFICSLLLGVVIYSFGIKSIFIFVGLFIFTPVMLINPGQIFIWLISIRPIFEKFIEYTSFGGPINLGGITNLIIILIFPIEFIRTHGLRCKPLKFFEFILFLFLAYIFLQIFLVSDRNLAIRAFLKTATLVSIYFLSRYYHTSVQRLNRSINIILIGSLIPAIVGVLQIFRILDVNTYTAGFSRITGTFRHPNEFAFYLLFLMPLVLFKINTLKDNRRLHMAVFFLIQALLFNTFTRSAWFGGFVFFLFWGFAKGKNLGRLMIILFLCLIVLVPVKARLKEHKGYVAETSVEWRMKYWKELWPRIQDRLIGSGLDTVHVETKLLVNRDQDVHNDYIRLIIESGWLGSILYWLFWLLAGINLSVGAVRIQAFRKIYLGNVLLIGTFLFCSFWDNLQACIASIWLLFFQTGAVQGLDFHKLKRDE